MAENDPVATTTIGPTIVIRGKLKSDEHLVVNGRIEAQISSTKELRVGSAGVLKADVRAQSAWVSGVVVGNIFGEQKVEIVTGGRVVGDLNAPRVVISDGAAFKGRISMQGFEAAHELAGALEADAAAGEPQAPPPTGAPATPTIWELPPGADRGKKRR
jgi:cytoskeletal protein CcmA (bactofilin family)